MKCSKECNRISSFSTTFYHVLFVFCFLSFASLVSLMSVVYRFVGFRFILCAYFFFDLIWCECTNSSLKRMLVTRLTSQHFDSILLANMIIFGFCTFLVAIINKFVNVSNWNVVTASHTLPSLQLCVCVCEYWGNELWSHWMTVCTKSHNFQMHSNVFLITWLQI